MYGRGAQTDFFVIGPKVTGHTPASVGSKQKRTKSYKWQDTDTATASGSYRLFIKNYKINILRGPIDYVKICI